MSLMTMMNLLTNLSVKNKFWKAKSEKNFIQIETRSLKQNHQKKHRQAKI